MLVTICAKDIEEYFKSFYLDNDETHDLNHVKHVMEKALLINDTFNLTNRVDLIMISAIAHDIYSSVDREQHHVLGYDYILSAKYGFFENMATEDRLTIAHAILEHRASHTGGYYSIISEIISAADRDEPDINKIVKRIYAYSCSFNNNYKVIHPIDNRNALKRTYEHLVDKYSRTGYARYNLLYNDFYGSKLKELWDIIDNITIPDIIKILENKN